MWIRPGLTTISMLSPFSAPGNSQRKVVLPSLASTLALGKAFFYLIPCGAGCG